MRHFFALILAAILAWQGALAFTTPHSPSNGWVWMAVAALLTAYAFVPTENLFAEPRAHREWSNGKRSILLGGLALALIGVGLNVWANLTLYEKTYDLTATAAWAGSLLLVLVGIAICQRVAKPQNPAPDPLDSANPTAKTHKSRFSWKFAGEIALLLAILALGIFLRLYRLHEIPPGIFIDETNAALDALNIFEGRLDSPFGTGWFETPTMYAYYLLGLFRVFGITWAALKAASLIPAILTLVALYPLARTLFGPATALAATFLLAINRWHINMSRWGWNEVAPPLFQLLSVFFLVRGAKSRRWLDFALAGLFLGLGMYTYLASRLVVASILLYVIYRVVVDRGFLRRTWPGLLIMAFVYVMVFSPLAATYVKNPFTFLNRSQQVSIFNDMQQAGNAQPLQENLRRHLEMFTIRGDLNPRHNLPGAPMLDPMTSSLFLVGLGYAIFRIKDHRRGLLLIWIPVTLVGGIFSALSEGPQAYRTLAVVPAICLLAGDTLVRGAAVIGRAWKLRTRTPRVVNFAQRGLAFFTVIALLGVGGYQNYTTFFEKQAQDPNVWQAFSPTETAVAREVEEKQLTHSLYLAPRLYFFSPLRFLTYRSPLEGGGGLRETPYHLAQPVDDLPVADLSGQDALFLLDTHYETLLELFTNYYPNTKSTMVTGPNGQPLYLSVTIPGAEIVGLHGLRGNYNGVERRDAQIKFTWPQDWPAEAQSGDVVWTGSLRVPASVEINLRVDGNATIELDNQLWNGPRFLGKGLHSLKIVQPKPERAGKTTLFWQVGGQAEEIVPAEALFSVSPPKNGLRATYYRSENWSGEPAFSQVSPVVLYAWEENEPWPGPFSDSFTGFIDAPMTGDYVFSVNGDDGVRLSIDGQIIGESLQPDAANEFTGSIALTAGRHAIRVDHFQRGGGKALELWWQPPNSQREVVPARVLSPD